MKRKSSFSLYNIDEYPSAFDKERANGHKWFMNALIAEKHEDLLAFKYWRDEHNLRFRHRRFVTYHEFQYSTADEKIALLYKLRWM